MSDRSPRTRAGSARTGGARLVARLRDAARLRDVAARRRTVVAGATALVVAAPLALAGTLGVGHDRHVLDLRAGSAWVVSGAQGLLSLVDGPTRQIAVGVRVPGAGHALSVAQSAAQTYLVDADTGTVAHVDAGTWAVGRPVALGTAGTAPVVLQNDPTPGAVPGGRAAHVVHVLDAAARTVARVDPVTLAVRTTLSLSAQPGPGQAAVADDGVLWLVDASSGTVTTVSADERAGTSLKEVHRTDAATTTARVLLAEGRPVLADPAGGTLTALDGSARATGCLDTRPTDDVRLLGSRTTREVFAAVAGALLVAAVDRQDCTRAYPVGDPATARFGDLAQSGRYVFVPDLSTGATTVVDTLDGTTASFDLTEPGHRVTLEGKDGLVFFNDLDGHRAGVLTLQGRTWAATALDKYDPRTGEGTEVVVPQGPQDAPGDDPSDDAPADDDADGATAPPGASPSPRAPDQARPDGARPPPDRAPGQGTRPGTATPRPGGPSTGPTATPTPDGPRITSLTVTPDPVVLGEPATFTAAATGTDGGTWAWALTDPGGATVATSDATGSFTHTLPREATAGAYGLRVTVTVGTLTATRTLDVDVQAPGVRIASLTPDAAQHRPWTTAVVTAEVLDADPAATWTWTAVSSASGPLTFTAPAPGAPLTLDTVGEEGTVSVTLTVASGGRQATRTLDLPVVYVCDELLVQTVSLDLPTVGSTDTLVVGIPGCRQEQVTVVVPSWMSGGGTYTLSPSDNSQIDVTRTGDPPVDGRNEGVVRVRLDTATPQEVAIDVDANIPPSIIPTAELPGGYTTCVSGSGVVNFYASYQDGDLGTLDVRLTVNGSSYAMTSSAQAPTLFWVQVPVANVGTASGWTVRAVDARGAASPVTAGTNAWSCW